MEPFSSGVISIMAISNAFELEFVAGLGYHKFARPSQGDVALRDDIILSQEEPVIHHWFFQFVPSTGIQDTELLLSEWRNLHAFFGPPVPALRPSMARTVSTICIKGTVSLCPMTPGCPRNVPGVNAGMGSFTAFLRHFSHRVVKHIVPSFALLGGHVMGEHFLVSRTPESTLSSGPTFFANWHLPCCTKLRVKLPNRSWSGLTRRLQAAGGIPLCLTHPSTSSGHWTDWRDHGLPTVMTEAQRPPSPEAIVTISCKLKRSDLSRLWIDQMSCMLLLRMDFSPYLQNSCSP
uniref:Uncharacterized protein n=1 Tax=Felis catus TaxID=9685 RepID=A0ABI7YPW0_FELCA